MPIIIERRRFQPEFRPLEVIAVEDLSSDLRRITLAGPALAGFASAGFDDHVKVFFPAEGTPLTLPKRGENGLIWPEDQPQPQMRDYTPRRFNAEHLVLDFVLHEGGPATTWAKSARIGSALGIGGPRGSFVVNTDVPRQILIGDLTAYPAIARRLEELPASVEAEVFLSAPPANHALPFDSAASVKVHLLDLGAEPLLDALAPLEFPAEDCLVFAGHEASVITELRAFFEARGFPSEHLRASNYWRKGTEDDQTHSH